MEKHFELNDIEFEEQFANCRLDPTWFSHEAHLRLAWIQVSKYGPEKAIGNVCSQITAFATYHGHSGKYHVTITIAAVRAVYHFMLKSESENFHDFIQEFPNLKNEFKHLLEYHYSMDIFGSEIARKEFIEPDLEPFDEIKPSE